MNKPTRSFASNVLWLGLIILVGAGPALFADGSGSAQASSGAAGSSVGQELLARYRDLLMEKGIVDDTGREIAGRLAGLIAGARGAGKTSDKAVLAHVLSALNYSASNLAGFPSCAFDRPIGAKMTNFGRSAVDNVIEATAIGSACPVGGIGAGGFERLMDGTFSTWFLKSGWEVEDTLWADQFHVFMKAGKTVVASTLSTETPPPAAGLGRWAWGYPAGKGDYFALYPKSGFSYEKNADWPVKLAVVQFSPVIAKNYRETSYPVAVYRWTAHNPTSSAVEVSLLLTWENMIGWEAVPSARPGQASFVWDKKSAGNFNEFVQAEGGTKAIFFQRRGMDVRSGNAMAGSMAIAVREVPGRVRVTHLDHFDPQGDGAEVWRTFAADGTLPETAPAPRSAGGRTAAALAVKFVLKPGERLEVPFAVAWDFPFYEFEAGAKHRKKYTEFFGAEGTGALRIAAEALSQGPAWEKAVDDWQRPIVSDPKLPGWFKQALLNELYVLTETSAWDAETNLHTYLESADYLMYGTFDVDSYCWHILRLWPELETTHMRYMAGTVPLTDSTFRAYQYATTFPKEVPPDKLSYYWSTVKVPGMVPHDIGSPRKRPWVALNAFDWQNANVWKDLNPKFPLRALRDYRAGGSTDKAFLRDMFSASVTAMDTLERRFGDRESHIPLNEGIPDQTYDTWRMKGQSAYVGLLWLAALRATIRMGEELAAECPAAAAEQIRPFLEKYRSWLAAGRTSIQRLWDEKGGYFHIDAQTDDIMTDQLFGIWYASMTGLDTAGEGGIIPPEQVKRTLATIYAKNVLGYGGGLLGAVNGRKADGRQLFSQQGDEVWVGTSYAFAAACVLNDMVPEALHTAYGLYHVIYSPFGQGYFFKTPEAYLNPDEGRWNAPAVKNGDRLFRAMKYMRPGAVWALYEALLKNPR